MFPSAPRELVSAGQKEKQLVVFQAIFPQTISVHPKLNPPECLEFGLNKLYLKTDTNLPAPITAFSLDQSIVCRKTFSFILEETWSGVYLILLCMVCGTK